MNSPLSNPTFRRLFAAQICSLLGVGLLTVSLSLAAFRIGGAAAGGQILGLLLALKMIAYVFLAPFAETLLDGLSRKRAMVTLDFGRMLLLLPMAFVSSIWQISALAFAFFALSAGFTPLFQSVIPDVLPEEGAYTKALSWSRIAYTMEALFSPIIAAAVLNLMTSEVLFYAAALAFLGSVLALLVTRFPKREMTVREGPFLKRVGRGLWIYRRTPRLRGLFLLNFALSLAMAWVLVNTVVFSGARLGDAERYLPALMACFGGGATVGAAFVPRLLRLVNERRVMLTGVIVFAAMGFCFSLSLSVATPVLAVVWTTFGAASSLVLTPGGLVITRSAARNDRAAVFAAQFSLSHAGWLVAYPLAGWLAAHTSLEMALLLLSVASVLIASAATYVWPVVDPLERVHSHLELPEDHPHLKQVPVTGARKQHSHAFCINELHPRWGQR